MNLKTGETAEHLLNGEYNSEFPTYNGRLTGRKTRYGYLVDHSDTVILQWSGIRKFDLDTGADLGGWSDDHTHSWYSEPWFAQADASQAEDHGYVVAFQWNDALKRQTLDIFDAKDLSLGPIAQVELPHRLPTGFHACWIESDRLALAQPA
jgi:carotenoid cleavage dioxygenase